MAKPGHGAGWRSEERRYPGLARPHHAWGCGMIDANTRTPNERRCPTLWRVVKVLSASASNRPVIVAAIALVLGAVVAEGPHHDGWRRTAPM